MMLVLLVYALFASTFTLGKGVLSYSNPIFFVGIRMTLAGVVLLGVTHWYKQWRTFSVKSIPLLGHIILFHIYCAYVFEYWALDQVTSIKAALVYSLAPFLTAIFAYFFLKDSLNRMTRRKWVGLAIGFMGTIPWLMSHTPGEGPACLGTVSLAEMALLFSVASAAYGWIAMRILIEQYNYSPLFINSVGMFVGGLLALGTSFYWEGVPVLKIPATYGTFAQLYLVPHFGHYYTALMLFFFYLIALLVIANGICYNLYGYLLSRYSATFLSFAGFTCPLFAALFGWFFHAETISYAFVSSMAIIFIGLCVFYRGEIENK